MRLILLALLLIHFVPGLSQLPGTDAVTVLQKVSQKLNSLSGVRYRYTREMKYHADNYHSKDSAAMFIDFQPALPMGVRFQAKKRETIFIYNGSMTIALDNSKMTMDTATILSAKRMESNSFLYSSLASLRNNLPLLIANDSISKVVNDTTVDGKQMLSIRMEGAGMYLNSFKGIEYFNEAGLRRPYFLLVNKKTMLPYQLIGKIIHGEDDRDFITVTYLDIEPKAAGPAKESWNYVSYKRRYSPYVKAESFPLVKPGAAVPFFNYPVFHPSKTDSLSLADLNGKVVLLEFWFKSCGPCIKAMPHYNDLQQKFGKKGFQLVTINIEDPINDIEFFYKKYPPTYPMLYNGLSLFQQLGFTGCPSSLLVDRNGKAAQIFFGFNPGEIEKSVSGLLNEK